MLDDLNAKGEAVRSDSSSPDFARSMSDIFERAGGVFSDASDRLSARGDTAAERILDELIIARIRQLPAPARAAFVSHVQDLVRAVESETVKVPVESVETVVEDAEQDDSVVADDADVRE